MSAICQWERLCLIKLYIRVNCRVKTSGRDDVLTAVLLNSHLFCDITFSRLIYRPNRTYYHEKGDSKLFRNTGNCIPNYIASHPTRLSSSRIVSWNVTCNRMGKQKTKKTRWGQTRRTNNSHSLSINFWDKWRTLVLRITVFIIALKYT
jgi:hypothetical protein